MSLSENQARLPLDISFQAKINQDQDESFDTKKLAIKNVKHVLLINEKYGYKL
jgi:hypothetical protein